MAGPALGAREVQLHCVPGGGGGGHCFIQGSLTPSPFQLGCRLCHLLLLLLSRVQFGYLLWGALDGSGDIELATGAICTCCKVDI